MLWKYEDRESVRHLSISPEYSVLEVSRNETVLKGPRKTATLHGTLYAELVALMDGTLRREDISARLGETFDIPSVERAISDMVQRSFARYEPNPTFELESALRFLDAVTSARASRRPSPLIRYSADGVLQPSPSSLPQMKRRPRND